MFSVIKKKYRGFSSLVLQAPLDVHSQQLTIQEKVFWCKWAASLPHPQRGWSTQRAAAIHPPEAFRLGF